MTPMTQKLVCTRLAVRAKDIQYADIEHTKDSRRVHFVVPFWNVVPQAMFLFVFFCVCVHFSVPQSIITPNRTAEF